MPFVSKLRKKGCFLAWVGLIGLLGCGGVETGEALPASGTGHVAEPDVDTTQYFDTEIYVAPELLEDQPYFELGTNVTGQSFPGSFTPLKDGSDIFVELGFQGSYMVVLSFRTSGYVDGEKINLATSLRVGDDVKADLKYKKKSLLAGGDSVDYFYNIFLVTDDYLEYVGQEAVARVELLTLDNEVITVSETTLIIRPPL